MDKWPEHAFWAGCLSVLARCYGQVDADNQRHIESALLHAEETEVCSLVRHRDESGKTIGFDVYKRHAVSANPNAECVPELRRVLVGVSGSVKAAWSGNVAMASFGLLTDGAVIVNGRAINEKHRRGLATGGIRKRDVPQRMIKDAWDNARDEAKISTRVMWVSGTKESGKPPAVALDARRYGEAGCRVAHFSAAKTKLILRVARPTSVLVADDLRAPCVFYRRRRAVAVLMPLNPASFVDGPGADGGLA